MRQKLLSELVRCRMPGGTESLAPMAQRHCIVQPQDFYIRDHNPSCSTAGTTSLRDGM